MSGSTQLDIKSEYYILYIKTPCMNFPDPKRETEYHSEKKRLFQKQLKVIKPILDRFFDELKNDPESAVKLTKYSSNFPEIDEETLNWASKEKKCPCRQNIFLVPGASIAGALNIDIAFSEFPESKAIKTLKHSLEKILKIRMKNEE